MNNLILTKEQINEMKEMQRELDVKIRENNNIDQNTDLSLEKYIALKTEFFELVNEIESFKFWKKKKGKDNIIEEACDMLHFILSLAIDSNVDIEMDEKVFEGFDVQKTDINEIIGITDAYMVDLFINKEWEELYVVLAFLLVIVNKCGFKADDLYNAYITKNKVNHKRQDNNY